MILALGCSWAAMAQPAYDLKGMNRELLNRGVVAVRNGQQVVVSWRTLTTDPVGEAYDVYTEAADEGWHFLRGRAAVGRRGGLRGEG